MAYSTIDKSSSFQNAVLYTGNGSTQSITGVGFQPDFTWIKVRNQAYNHYWFDVPRGAGEYLKCNQTAAETDGSADHLTAWTSDGFNLGDTAGVNENTSTFASWSWKGGTTSGLSGGTITPSSYSFNSTSRCGIYKRTGTASAGTITHGLGGIPRLIITKNLTSTSNWRMYWAPLGAGNGINLNETAGDYSDANLWNGTVPTSTVYSIGSSNDTNASGDDFVDYVFCDVKGYSKINRYKGNGNANGPIIYTGFKPSFILIKRWNTSGGNWWIWDNKREGYNEVNDNLYADINNAEDTSGRHVNIFSNGFKIIATDNGVNGDGNMYLYAAFGQPIVGSNGVTATAR